MTAPGNATLLFSLLAVFAACTGYAVGRLHQWYRTEQDREVAYRDGYDMAARSTFSLAARLVGPRRDKAAVRASASVHTSAASAARSPAGAQATGLPGVPAEARHVTPAGAPVSRVNDSAAVANDLTSSVRATSSPAESPSSAGPQRAGEPTGLRGAGEPTGLRGAGEPTGLRRAGAMTGLPGAGATTGPGEAGQLSWTPFPVPGATETSGIGPEIRAWSSIPASQVADPAALPAATEIAGGPARRPDVTAGRPDAEAVRAYGLRADPAKGRPEAAIAGVPGPGVPADPMAGRPDTAIVGTPGTGPRTAPAAGPLADEPAHGSGLRAAPVAGLSGGDAADGSGLRAAPIAGLAEQGSGLRAAPVTGLPGGGAAGGSGVRGDSSAGRPDGEAGGKPKQHRRGRHFVPDELVRAATYRLSPDRVARAKVPGAEPPDQAGPRHSVPKPRTADPEDE